jgi:alpha-2-macroglobulin
MTRDPLMDFEYDSSAEATAFALKLLVKRQPESPLLPKAALWLVNHRNEGFYWNSTKQTAFVIFGLTDYLKASGELKPNFSVQVLVNDRQVLTKTFTAADALSINPPTIRIPASALASGENRIRIVKNGAGLLYWNTRGEYYSTEDRLTRTGSIALNLLRDYFRLVPERVNEKIVYRLAPLDGPIGTGDVIAVRLTASGGNWKYLQIEDPIPAGAEFVERDDLYELKEKPPWWTQGYTRREFHDDRAAFFQTNFSGQSQQFYLLKVVNSGAFRASPARVQPMYQPQYLSTTESRSITVQP